MSSPLLRAEAAFNLDQVSSGLPAPFLVTRREKRALIARRMTAWRSSLRIPRGAFVLAKEIARVVLRRPVVGVASVARTPDGRWLLIRRADVGEWALPGGTLEWGETLRDNVARELREEAGVDRCEIVRLVGVFSRFHRDPRFHAVTVVVECSIDPPSGRPANPLEIREARLFERGELPLLAMGMQDMIEAALNTSEPIVE
jgi:8-oxo-dGTP diphosphatase